MREHPSKEITYALVDERLEEIQGILESLKGNKAVDHAERTRLVAELDRLARQRPRSSHEQPIHGARQPLKDLSLRTFRRLITAYIALGDHRFVTRLFDEIERNPDYRLTRKLISSARRFPGKRHIASRVAGFLQSPLKIFPHQEAELLWAVRYLARVPLEIVRRCEVQLLDQHADFYVRVQCARLLSRCRLSRRFIRRCHAIFLEERSYLVQASLVGLLTQLPRSEAKRMLELTQFHPNDVIRNTAILLISVRDDIDEARSKLKHIFRDDTLLVLCDCVPLLYAMALSDKTEILRQTRERLRRRRRIAGLGDLVHVFDDLILRIERIIRPELPLRGSSQAAPIHRGGRISSNASDAHAAAE